MIRLVQADFRRWLRRNDGKIVGDPTEVTSCPLCRYLKSHGAKKVRMTIAARYVDNNTHMNSAWARSFQHRAIALQRQLRVEGLRGREALEALIDVT